MERLLQIEIPNIDNPHGDTVSVHSTGSYAGADDATSDASGSVPPPPSHRKRNPGSAGARRRSSVPDPNEKFYCKYCEDEMPSRKEKIKHQVRAPQVAFPRRFLWVFLRVWKVPVAMHEVVQETRVLRSACN